MRALRRRSPFLYSLLLMTIAFVVWNVLRIITNSWTPQDCMMFGLGIYTVGTGITYLNVTLKNREDRAHEHGSWLA